MEFVALDGTKLLALMVAGGIFALAGLRLMFRSPAEGHAATIKLFGLEFQSSSAGLLVFLIGAVFLAVPIFVPERPPTTVTAPDVQAGAVASGSPSEPATGSAAIILPPKANASEQEPNNFVTEATQIARGTFYSGVIDSDRNDAEDWFVIPTERENETRFQLRARGESNTGCDIAVLNDREERLENFDFPPLGSSLNEVVFVGESSHLFYRVYSEYDCKYELMVH